MRASEAPGNVRARMAVARSALASRFTACCALPASLHTWAARKPMIRPKRSPMGGSIPGETALNASRRFPTASHMTTTYTTAAARKDAAVTTRTSQPSDRFSIQSVALAVSPMRLRLAACERQLDLALPATELLDPHADRVAEAENPSPTPSGQCRAQRVQLEVVAVQAARREEALEDISEADEE